MKTHINEGASSPPFLLVEMAFNITPNFSQIFIQANDAKRARLMLLSGKYISDISKGTGLRLLP